MSQSWDTPEWRERVLEAARRYRSAASDVTPIPPPPIMQKELLWAICCHIGACPADQASFEARERNRQALNQITHADDSIPF